MNQHLVSISARYEDRKNVSGLRYGIIEVTTQCQLRCPGCFMVRRNALNHGEMSLGQAIRILDLCRDYCGRDLETMDLLGGEPLLWPYLRRYLETLLKRGILPWIFTNMLAIAPELAKWLYERQIHVTGKLNIGEPSSDEQLELQAEMIGSPLKAARKMVEAIGVFRQAGYRDPLFRLQNLVRLKNIGIVPDYYRWCLKNNIGTDLELMGSGEPIDVDYWAVAPNVSQIAKMVRAVQSVRAEFGLPPAEVLMPHVFGACPFYDKGLYFAVDGSIRACSNSTVTLANVSDTEPIRKAYKSELVCNRLKLTRETVKGPCSACHKWEKCRGGCRATVEGMGDPFGSYPLCPVPLL